MKQRRQMIVELFQKRFLLMEGVQSYNNANVAELVGYGTIWSRFFSKALIECNQLGFQCSLKLYQMSADCKLEISTVDCHFHDHV
nr:hypothetical transcript [Hymenolepis microstoma]